MPKNWCLCDNARNRGSYEAVLSVTWHAYESVFGHLLVSCSIGALSMKEIFHCSDITCEGVDAPTRDRTAGWSAGIRTLAAGARRVSAATRERVDIDSDVRGSSGSGVLQDELDDLLPIADRQPMLLDEAAQHRRSTS